MNLYGLIGYPLSHSFSVQYFTEKFFRENIRKASYELFPLDKVEKIILLISENKDLKGLNVTIPYKVQVMSLLSYIDSIAKETGAVNTIKIIRADSIITEGFNTDIFGFEESLKPLLKKHHNNALILGDGGASKAVVYVLKKLGIAFNLVTRHESNPDNAILYSDLNEEIIATHKLIINTTPVGMFPHLQDAPDIPYKFISKEHLLYDLVYNPEETQFMKMGIASGADVCNGLQMLYLQAEKSWQIWQEGKELDV